MKLFVYFTFSLILSVVLTINIYFICKQKTKRLLFSKKSQISVQDKSTEENYIPRLNRHNFNNIGGIVHESGISSYANVPNIIIQYGVGGTATTLQFQILCVLMAIIHESEISDVGCFFGAKPFFKYTVMKTHELRVSTLRSLPLDSWIFTTSSSSLTPEKELQYNLNFRNIQSMKLTCPYTAAIETVAKRGHFIIYDYQSIFGMSDEQIQKAVEYLRYWDILRLCCGKQMSADWRNYLSPRKKYVLHHDPHSSTYPACEMYNISEVENLLMKTNVFENFANKPSLRDIIGKPSNVDGNINGNYCEHCNRNISMKHLHFNENCV